MKKLEIQLTESVNGVAFGTDRTVVDMRSVMIMPNLKKAAPARIQLMTTAVFNCFTLLKMP